MIDLYPVTAVVAGAVAFPLGFAVPRMLGRLPEPEPEDEPEQADNSIPASDPEADAKAEDSKEPYADIAALPGLGWKSALAAAACAAPVGLMTGWTWSLVILVALVPVSVALSVVDWRTRLLPTRLIAPTYFVMVALVLLGWLITRDTDDLIRAGWGWLLAGGLYLVLWFIYPRGMGYGDVRLSGILGIALGYAGWSELVVGIYGGFLLGGILGGLLALFRRVDRSGYPFGPFMLLGALVGVVLGPVITSSLVA